MAISGNSTIIIDVTLTSEQASQKVRELADRILQLKDRQDILKASGRQLGAEFRNNAQQINQLERATRAYVNIAATQGGSLNQLRSQLSLATAQFDALSRAERNNQDVGGKLATQIQQLQKEITSAEQATGRFQRNVGNYTKNIEQYATSFFSLGAAIGLIKKTFDTALETDATRTALGYILESTNEADVKLRQLKNTAEDLGLGFVETEKAYQMFIGAAKASNFSLDEADKIFNSVSRVLGVLHVPAAGATRAFYALQEMISMGTVQSRQLNRMLGLVIPGSTKIMADAIGVTVEQLHEMQKAGDLVTSEVLPKFADQLDKAIAPGVDKIESLQAAVSNLGSAFETAVDENSGINKFFTTMVKGWTSIVKIVTGSINDLTTGVQTGNWDAFLARLTNSDTADKISELQRSYKNTIETINNSTIDPSQYEKLNSVFSDITKSVTLFKTSLKDGSLTDTGKIRLKDYENSANIVYGMLQQIKQAYPNIGTEVKKVTELTDEQLTSVKQIRDRISDLQKLPGSAVADDAIFKRIKALQDRLKSLRGTSDNEEKAALKRIAEDRIKTELAIAQSLLTARQKQYQDVNADIDKRVALYKKYGQDTTRLERERQVRLSELQHSYFIQDERVVRDNLNKAAQIRISLITDADERERQKRELDYENEIRDVDTRITSLAARTALGERGLTDLLNSELEKRKALTDKYNYDTEQAQLDYSTRLTDLERAGRDAAYQAQVDDLNRQFELNQQKMELNQQLTSSYKDLVDAIGGLTSKNTAFGKVAFLAQKAFAIQQIIFNAELAKSQIILRYEILKTQAATAASLAGPFAPFVAAAAIAGLTAAQGAEIAKATASEIVQVGIVAATAVGGFAEGGMYKSDGKGALLPGYSKRDNVNSQLRSGEAVIVSEATRDPNTRQLLSDINQAYGGKAFASGGVYGGSFMQQTNADISSQIFNRNAVLDAASKIKIYTVVTDVTNAQNKEAKIVEAGNF